MTLPDVVGADVLETERAEARRDPFAARLLGAGRRRDLRERDLGAEDRARRAAASRARAGARRANRSAVVAEEVTSRALMRYLSPVADPWRKVRRDASDAHAPHRAASADHHVTSAMSDYRRPKLGRNVIALAAVSFLTDVSSEMIYPLLPVFLTTVLGANASFIGAIEGAAETTAALLKLASGWWSDRVREAQAARGRGLRASRRSMRPLVAIATSAVAGAR